MRFRLVASVLPIAFLLVGCFSASPSLSPSLRQEVPTLYSDSELRADGPPVQEVTVRALADGKPVAVNGLQVRGRTADGQLVEVDWAVPAYGTAADGAAEGGHDAGSAAQDRDGEGTDGALTFAVDMADLRDKGVVRLEMTWENGVFTLPIQGAGDPHGSDGERPDPDAADEGLGGEGAEDEGPGGAADGPLPEEFDGWLDEAALERDLVADTHVEVEAEAEEGGFQWEAEGEPEFSPAWSEEASMTVQAPASVTRQVRMLRAGTSQATPAYIIRSGRPGPTVVVVGGMHGSETAGWLAAGEIKDWQIDRGTLVVIPQANRQAVQRSRRTGFDGVDLNRQFPVHRTPRTPLAREIWALVREFRPVALMDLHEGWGVRRLGHRFPGGTPSVGQTLITYPAKDARRFASYVTRYVDTRHVGPSRVYRFMNIGPPVAGSLARKAGVELNIPAFIVEPSQYRTTVATRVRWHKAFVEQLLKWYGLVDRGRVLVPTRYRAALPAGFPGDPAALAASLSPEELAA